MEVACVEKYKLVFENCMKMGEDIWFSAGNYNGLYRYNLNEKNIERVANFPNEDMIQWDLYHNVCKYHNSLVFIPCYANTISIYNIEKKVFDQIEIPDVKKNIKNVPDFLEGKIYKDKLFVIGYAYPGIIKVDLKTYKVEIVYRVHKNNKYISDIYFGNRVEDDKNLLYIPCSYRNAILIFNMDCNKVFFKEIGNSSNRYSHLVKDNNNLYLFDKNSGNVIFWDKKNDKWKEINIRFTNINRDVLMCLNNKYIWVVSILSGEVFQIDKKSKKVFKHRFQQKWMIDYITSYKNGIYLLDAYANTWYYINNQGIITDLNIELLEPRDKTEVWKEYNRKKIKEIERTELPIQYLIYILSAQEEFYIKHNILKFSMGNLIWNKLQ